MGTRWAPAAGIVVLLLALTACTGRGIGTPAGPGTSAGLGTSAGQHGAASTSPSFDEQEKANRTRAESEARRLLALAEIPAGSVQLSSAPAALPAPAMGDNGVETATDLARYWQLPMSFPAAEDYLKQHPPAGLTQWGGSAEGSPTAMVHSYGWTVGGSSPQGGLEFGLASIGEASAAGTASYLRVDARVEWLDPHPMADTGTGPRMRLEAGSRCPADDRGVVGVLTDRPDVDRSLVPPGTPNAGLLCSYGGLNGKRFGLLLQRVLTAEDAARVADVARRVELGHLNGGSRNCPAGDGSVTVLMLEYPHLAAANLWLEARGCASASNGHIRAPGSATLAALIEVANQLER
ncbi:hypothetical protein [Jatrophihabitans sp.]|jgi:hypothetical protein|uniref:hypothetical protein n=1 Tax=Jatrophihabitans sp. TaxID=1932789 RepID=UPI002F0232EC